MNELVTIVVPVYNVEKYLEDCVLSIMAQTYKNIEVILVDDGSTDNSGSICDRFQKSNKNIVRTIHKKNGGLSDARNTGIENAKGSFITFIDSDDIIWDRYVEVLMKRMQKTSDVDIVQGNYVENINELGQRIGQEYLFDGNEALKKYLTYDTLTVSACAKLFRRSLFDTISFPVGRINEDNLTIYKLFYSARNVAAIPFNIYYYHVNQGTIMHGKFSKKRFEVVSVYDEIKEFLGAEFEKYTEETQYHNIRILFWVYNEALLQSGKNSFKKEKEEIRFQILRDINVKNAYLEKRYVLYYYILKISPDLYRKILRTYRRNEVIDAI